MPKNRARVCRRTLLGFIFSTYVMQEGSASGPAHSLEEKVDILTAQFSQLVQMLTPHETHQPSAENVEEEVEEFLSHHEEEEVPSPVNGKVRLPKFAPPQMFDGTMKDTKSFISFIILYIKGREPDFHTVESKIMFALSYMQGVRATPKSNSVDNVRALQGDATVLE